MAKSIDQNTAIEIVREHIKKKNDWDIDANQPMDFDVSLTSFSRTSAGWAAELYTNLYPLLFFCVFYYASKNEAYLVEYKIVLETTIFLGESDVHQEGT